MNAPFPPPERKTTKFYSVHARERARERYGIDLSSTQMKDIFRACRDGRASKMATLEGLDVFIWRFHGVLIYPALTSDHSMIVSFFPREFFLAGNHRKRQCKPRGTWATPRVIDGRGTYNRAKANRKAMAEEGE